jgi:addiction module HigA family antidote
MHNPLHPGIIVRDLLIEGAALSVTDAAQHLGVTQEALDNLLNGHTGINPEMAIRLSTLLNTSSDMWLNLQKNYDLSKAEVKRKA